MSGFQPSWGPAKAVNKPVEAPEAPQPLSGPVRAPRAVSVRSDPLARQVAQALVDEAESRQLTLVEFAALTGVGLSSVRAHRYGQGLRVDTLEKYAKALGWTITITNETGTIGEV